MTGSEADSAFIRGLVRRNARWPEHQLRASEIARRRGEEERAEALFPLRATMN